MILTRQVVSRTRWLTRNQLLFKGRAPTMVEGKRLYQSHEERTAGQPRRGGLHAVVVKHVDEVNENIRLLRLKIIDQQRGVEVCPDYSPCTVWRTRPDCFLI